MDSSAIALIRFGLIQYLILASSIALHEWGHALAADKLGDGTPRSEGRVTLNPLAHLDPIGTGLIPLLMIFSPLFFGSGMPVALIGWGRPVRINVNHFKSRVRDHLLVTVAGPAMNFAIALGAAVLGGILAHQSVNLVQLFVVIITINSALIVFNLIPVPPLDGSHFMRYAVGMREETFIRLSYYGLFILLFLINFHPAQRIMTQAIIELRNIYLILIALIGPF